MMVNGLGNKCCLGFFAMANGATCKLLNGTVDPSDVLYSHPRAVKLKERFGKLLVRGDHNSALCRKMMLLNDNNSLSEPMRETKLTKLFAKLGWKPKFID